MLLTSVAYKCNDRTSLKEFLKKKQKKKQNKQTNNTKQTKKKKEKDTEIGEF